MSSRLDELASPCIGVCIMDTDRGHCHGCQRTLDEISSWLDYTPAERRAVLEAIEQRRLAADPLEDP